MCCQIRLSKPSHMFQALRSPGLKASLSSGSFKSSPNGAQSVSTVAILCQPSLRYNDEVEGTASTKAGTPSLFACSVPHAINFPAAPRFRYAFRVTSVVSTHIGPVPVHSSRVPNICFSIPAWSLPFRPSGQVGGESGGARASSSKAICSEYLNPVG